MKSLLLILLLATIAAGQSIQDQIKAFDKPKSYEVTYDKFAKETKVEIEVDLSGNRSSTPRSMTLLASATIPDEGERSYTLVMFPNNRIYSSPTLRILIDGDLLDIESFSGIRDYAAFQVTPEQWAKIANGKVVELQLVTFETTLNKKVLSQLRNLASLKK